MPVFRLRKIIWLLGFGTEDPKATRVNVGASGFMGLGTGGIDLMGNAGALRFKILGFRDRRYRSDG